MAKEKEEVKGLVAIAKKMAELREGTNMPSGKKDDVAENQVTELDMIAGICSAALFGSANRNKDNYQNLLSNPNKSSYLGQIYTLLNKLDKQLKPLIVDKALQVKLLSTGMSSALGQIIIDINGINNVVDLNRVLVELAENTNNVGLLDGLTGIFDVISKINELTSIDTSKIITNVKNINDLATELENVGEIKIIDSDKLNQIVVTTDDLNRIVAHINQLPKEINDNILSNGNFRTFIEDFKSILTDFNEDKLKIDISKISDIFDVDFSKLFSNISAFLDENKTIEQKYPRFQKNLGKLIEYLNPDSKKSESIAKIFEYIAALANKATINNTTNFQVLTTALNGVLQLISFDTKINIQGLYRIRELTKKDGIIDQIFTDLIALGSKEISKNVRTSIDVISSYFDAIKNMTNIGVFGKLRIMTNLVFVKKFVNKQLPSLIEDINKNFKNLKAKKIEGLDNLITFFDVLSHVGEISLKNKLKMSFNLWYIQNFILNDVVNLIKTINTTLKNTAKSGDLEVIEEFFNGILKIIDIDSKKLDMASNNLDELFYILCEDETSLISIFKKLNENKDIYDSSAITNLDINGTQLFDFINNINIDEKAIKKFIKAGTLLRFTEFPLLNSIIKYINKDLKFDKKLKNNIASNKSTLSDIVMMFILPEESIVKLASTKEALEIINNLNVDIQNIVKVEKLLGKFKKVLEKEADAIVVFIDKLSQIDSKKLKSTAETITSATSLIKELTKLVLISAGVLIIGSIAMSLIDIKNLFAFAGVLGGFILLMGGICIMISRLFKDVDIDKIKNLFVEIQNLILFSSAILILGSLVMNFIDVTNLFAFTLTLGLFMLGLCGICYILQSMPNIEKLKDTVKSFGELVLICGLTLIFGSMITQFIDFKDLITFALNLALFMTMLALPLWLYSKISSPIFQSAKDFAMLIMVCGATLIYGALITHFIKFADLISFAFNLALFMTMLALPLWLYSKISGTVFKGAKDFGILVLVCGATLIFGALFMQIDGLWEDALKFAGILGLFILGICTALGLGALIAGGKRGLKFAKELNILIAISALALVLGPILINTFLDGKYSDVLKFAAILGLFVIGITLSIGLAAKIAGGKGIAIAFGLSILIGVVAAVLILGPWFINEAGIPYSDILTFGAIILGFVTLFGLILGVMGMFAAQIGLGLLCTAGIGLVTFGLALVMLESHRMMSQINWDEFWTEWENAGILFTIITGVVAILGGIMMSGIGAAVLALGAVAFAAIEGLIFGLAKCISIAADAVKKLKEIEGLDVKELMGPFADFLKYGFGAVWDNISLKKLWFLNKAKYAIKGLGEVIGLIAEGIKTYSELKIPIYENGKLVGYRNLTNEDFENAAKNIAIIITCVGGAIMGLFGMGPMANNMTDAQKEVAMEMLKVESGGLFRSNKTKFGMIVEASAGLGKVIKEIAEGTMTWSKLPEDFDAEAAAKNIGLIITCVGGSIMGLFGSGPFAGNTSPEQQEVAKEMMQVEGGLFRSRKTKFGLIVEATSGLGQVIKDIADGAMKYSELPAEFDATKVAVNVGLIVTVLGKALMDLYNTEIGKEMFASSGGGLFSLFTGTRDNKFKRVADSVGQIGTMISNIMEGVQAYANLSIPTEFNEEGKPIKFRHMEDSEFDAAQQNIGKLIITLGEAVMKVGQSNAFLTIFGGEALKNISEAILNVSQTVSPIANSMWMYAQGMFPKLEYQDGKLVTTGWFDCKDGGGIDNVIKNATDNIGKMIIGLAGVFANIMSDDTFEDLIDEPEDVQLLAQSIASIANTTNTIFDIIGKIIEKPMLAPLVQMMVVDPFNTFIEGVMWKEKDKDKDLKYWLLDNTGDVEDYKDNLITISKGIFSTFEVINKIVQFGLTKQSVEEIKNSFDTYINITKLLDNFVYNSDTFDNLSDFNDNIEDWIKIIDKVDLENTENKTNVLANSITTLFGTIADLQQNSGFADHVDTVKRYVEAINDVDIDKIESMTNLAFAVTNLGDKIGNIDKFTDTLAKKIALTLNALTKQIKDASVIIKDADTLHKKRETSIKNSIGKITDLMNKSMVVEIKNDQPTTTLTGGTGGSIEGGGGTNTTETTPGGGSDTTLVQTPPNSNGSSSGRSGGSSIEIDYDKLAKAIARAFKQM